MLERPRVWRKRAVYRLPSRFLPPLGSSYGSISAAVGLSRVPRTMTPSATSRILPTTQGMDVVNEKMSQASLHVSPFELMHNAALKQMRSWHQLSMHLPSQWVITRQ
eukprot:scaffold34187_cov16-Prasinocladus_malaysianus.AAC.1